MLQRIRDRITGKFALAILALLALPFVFFGINYNFIGLGYAAKVNGEDISVNAFESAYRNQLLALAEQGQEIPSELRGLVRDGVLDRLIGERLVEQYVGAAKFAVPNQAVTDAIQREPTWQVDGAFSRDVYYQWLEQRALTPAEFEANQRQFLRQSQLQRGVGASAFVTPAEYRRYLNLYLEQRQVQIAELDIGTLIDSIEVEDDAVSAFYDARPDDFQAPEMVDFRYVELNRDRLASDLEITEQDLTAYYEDTKDRYQQDERRRARHILIPFGDDEAAAEQQAQSVSARAQAGEPFEDLARQYSKDGGTAQSGGDLGLLLQTQLPPAVGEAVFAMDSGDIEGPVRSTFGFHIVRLDDIQAGGALPLAEVRGEVEQFLRADRATAAYDSLERSLSDALFDADDVEAIAAATGLEVREAQGFTRAGGDPFGANQTAIDGVFDETVLEDRDLSDILELDANRSVVLQVSDYHPAARRPIEDVQDDIIAAIKSERALEIATERAASVQSALGNGEEMDGAAPGDDGWTTRTVVIGRTPAEDENVGELQDPRLRGAVFQEKKPAPGQTRMGTVLTGDNKYAVYAVTGYAPGRPESIPLAERDAAKLQLGALSGSQDFAALVLDLQQNAEIVKSEDVLAADSVFE